MYNFCGFSVLRIHFLDCLDASYYPGLVFAPGWHEQRFKRGIQSGSIWWGGGIVGRAGGSYEAEEGEEGLLGGALPFPLCHTLPGPPSPLHSLPYHHQVLATPFYTLPYFNYIVCHGIIGAWQTIYTCSISALCDAEFSCRQVF